jgi:hypothetical protein
VQPRTYLLLCRGCSCAAWPDSQLSYDSQHRWRGTAASAAQQSAQHSSRPASSAASAQVWWKNSQEDKEYLQVVDGIEVPLFKAAIEDARQSEYGMLASACSSQLCTGHQR